MNLALLIPDGVGFRNFVLGPFLSEAARRNHVDVLHGIPPELLDRFNGVLRRDTVRWQQLEPDADTRGREFLRNALAYAHLNWANTGLMRLRLGMPVTGSTLGRRMFTRAARLVGRVAATRRGIEWLDRWHARAAFRSPSVERYRQMLREWRPSVLFCSHQRPNAIVAPVLAARSLGIPTATFIFSWDNLSSKGRIAAPFDHFLVWSELMRDELLRFYPDVSAERVHIVGTPQFEPYADMKLLWSREEFCRRVNADPARKLICYTGADPGTCPGDPEYVRVLLEHIRSGAIRGNPQLLLRPTPVDEGSRYDALRRDYPELLYARPEWAHSATRSWESVVPSPGDVQFLANLTQHGDLNVNWASTMTLDFALRDKPVVNVAFDVGMDHRYGVSAWDLYTRSEHYRPVIELGAARVARSSDELAAHVNAYLDNPTLDRAGRRKLVELEIAPPVGASSGRILAALARIGR